MLKYIDFSLYSRLLSAYPAGGNMRSVHDWLNEYGESHRHPLNVLIHKICVPAIMFTILGLLWMVPIGTTFNLAMLVSTCILIFYARLSLPLCVGMAGKVGIMFAMIYMVQQVLNSPAIFYIAVFIVAWIFQFIGHKIEGKKPSFFQDLVFLLIGPLWTLNFLYKKMGIKL